MLKYHKIPSLRIILWEQIRVHMGKTDFMDEDLSQNEGLSYKTGYSNLQITDMEKHITFEICRYTLV